MKSNKPQIFLSYAHEDAEIAEKIYTDLAKYGLNVWFDSNSLLPGQRWKVEIEKAIKNSTHFIALISDCSVNKRGYVQKELKQALDVLDEFPESEIFVIPVRLDDCEPSHEKLKDLHWVDFFPEDEYSNGVQKILNVIRPNVINLRSKTISLSENEMKIMLRKYKFFDPLNNDTDRGITHEYIEKEIDGHRVIIDYKTNLMWQKGGTENKVSFQKGKEWINRLNGTRHATYNDWRLPTLEEAMSLMEPEQKNGKLYIESIFDMTQKHIWTPDEVSDESNESRTWIVAFCSGSCYGDGASKESWVRAIRSL
ncbi:MAG: TIR domain-containing protein [Candidatus Lokiarchaeota archaeon]|nr:TIR domain-containing protein [Candidatus Lokiarchaeota archaeon]